MQAANQSRKRPWSRPLADFVSAAIDPVAARQGFGESDLILYWEDIVGDRMAAMSEPIKLRWPARGGSRTAAAPEPATLVVRVESGFALELQHLAPVVIARVNAHLGWNCIGRLALKQGPLQRQNARRRPKPAPSAAAQSRAQAQVADIAEEGLRHALARLGAHILDRSPASR
jgi:hypothetical protein